MVRDINKEIENLLAISNNKIKDIFFYTVNFLIEDYQNSNLLKQFYSDNPEKFKILVGAVESILKGTNKFYKYESFSHYKNINKDVYTSVSTFSGFLPEFEYGSKELRPLIKVLKFIYDIDKNKFEIIIKKDEQKLVYLYFMIGHQIDFSYKELTGFLKSGDKIIQNGALYYLINNLESLIQEKQFLERNNEETNKLKSKIKKELSNITEVLCDLPKAKKMELLVDYYFYMHRNDELAEKLEKELQGFSGNLEVIIKDRIEIDNPYTFTKLIPLISRKDLKKLFEEEFYNWFKNDFNGIIWDNIKEKVIKALNKYKISVINDLKSIPLYISDFDKQTRFSKYIKDSEKSQALNNLSKDILTQAG